MGGNFWFGQVAATRAIWAACAWCAVQRPGATMRDYNQLAVKRTFFPQNSLPLKTAKQRKIPPPKCLNSGGD